MRMYAALNLGDGSFSAATAAERLHRVHKRYLEHTRLDNSREADPVRFLLSSDEEFGAFIWPVNSIVRRKNGGMLGVVVGYSHCISGWRVKVKFANGTGDMRYDEVEDAQLPSELVEIAIGSRDTIKEKVHEKVEEAFA